IPEGLRSDEVLALLAGQTGTSPQQWQQVYQQLLGGKEGEGRLLPETYTYRKPVNPHAILLDMLKGQHDLMQRLVPTWLDAEKLRIVASIIEKETAVDKERPLVAAVIRNRLAKRMALQMDPTVIYGLWRTDGTFSGNLHKGDLKRDTPWSSYTRKGLPPTPICNPGEASLKAAAQPADVDYLYFVADGSGGHAFASTLEEHNANVRQWIKIERKR
ncbi:MAG: endolytic transglycosylase MltG, partial [Mariprofundaceae bacterium]|nr:endolytic transglycosylase MltG [Mariprofundaceae bacterium]